MGTLLAAERAWTSPACVRPRRVEGERGMGKCVRKADFMDECRSDVAMELVHVLSPQARQSSQPSGP